MSDCSLATGNGQQAIILVASDRQTIFETSEEESVPYSPSLEGVVVTYRIERERYLYFSVVTGTCYGTKTPPGWQPAN